MCFPPYLGVGCRGGGEGCPKRLVHRPFLHHFILHGSKIEVSETHLVDFVINQSDHPRDVLGTIDAALTLFGCVGGEWGAPKALVHNLWAAQ